MRSSECHPFPGVILYPAIGGVRNPQLGIRRDVAATVKRSLAGARDDNLKLEIRNWKFEPGISGNLPPFDMDPGSSPGVTAEEGAWTPGLSSRTRSGTGVTAAEKHRTAPVLLLGPASFRHSCGSRACPGPRIKSGAGPIRGNPYSSGLIPSFLT